MNLLSDQTDAIKTAVSICGMIKDQGGKAYFVGGSVRDRLLNQPIKEYDIEVYGITPQNLIQLIGEKYQINLVGRSFGVIKLRDFPIDISLPRREIKSGTGHRDFIVASDHTMTHDEACKRRDFTINAMLFDPLSDTLIDPLNGQNDLKLRILRHCSGQFTEDPLRVLRGMRFCAVFKLTPAAETVSLLKEIDISSLTKSRVFDEWRKMFLNAENLSIGLEFLRITGLDRFYPELKRMQGCPQDPIYHPEGDVWNHTKLCLDAFGAFKPGDEHSIVISGLAVLCHDMGKPDTTVFKKCNRIGSARHDMIGEIRARQFLEKITETDYIFKQVLPLVRYHMVPYNLYKNNNSLSSIRRLAHKTGNIKLMSAVVAADHNGRNDTPSRHVPEAEYLLKMAEEMELLDKKPVPLVLGRHLIKYGLPPGKFFGEILSECFEAQLNGDFSTEIKAEQFLEKMLQSKKLIPKTN